MSLFDLFRAKKAAKPTAETARDRLQIVLAHERISRSGDDFLPRLQEEIMAVVARYVDVEANKANVKLERGDDVSVLEIEIELPPVGLETPRRARHQAAASS